MSVTDEKLSEDAAPLRAALRVTVKQQELVVNLLVRIERLNKRLEYLELAMRGFDYHDSPDEDSLKAAQVIRGGLYQDMAKAYKDMFAFANLFPELRGFACKVIAEDFCSDNRGVMHLLDPDGKYPGSYRTSDEEDLKKAIKWALIQEREKVDA